MQIEVIDQMIENQRQHLLRVGRKIHSNLTEDDILQPFDFVELENNPHFRYEEGVLHGFQAAKAAILAEKRKSE